MLTASSALALAACAGGSNGDDRRATPGPVIERAVAEQLADRSDRVAELLESGDACGAKDESTRLRDELTQAINQRAIPDIYLEDLSGAVNELQAQSPPCEKPKEKEKKEKDKGNHDGDGDE